MTSRPLSGGLAEFVKEAMKNWTARRLAAEAKVSNKTVLTLLKTAEGQRLEEQLGGAAGTSDGRKTDRLNKWLRVLAQVALALKDTPERYFQFLKDKDLSISEKAEREAIAAAEERVHYLRRSPPADTLEEFRRVCERSSSESYPIPVKLLTRRPKDDPENAFYKRYVTILFRTISPRLEPKWDEDPSEFQDMLGGVSSSPLPKYRLLVGAYELVSRSLHQVSFVTIPGRRVRLACIGDKNLGLSWRDVEMEPRRREDEMQPDSPPSQGVRPMVIANTVGHVHLRFCGWDESELLIQHEYDVNKIAEAFAKELGQNRRTVLVAGEYEANSILQHMPKPATGPAELGDLATDQGTDPPSYQVAMAVGAADLGWRGLLQQATTELFQNTPGIIAEVYARYLVRMWKEHLDQESSTRSAAPERGSRRSGKSADREAIHNGIYQDWFEKGRLPSLLQLHEIGIPATGPFRRQLGVQLEGLLKHHRLTTKEWPGHVLIARLVPSPQSETDEILAKCQRLCDMLEEIKKSFAEAKKP